MISIERAKSHGSPSNPAVAVVFTGGEAGVVRKEDVGVAELVRMIGDAMTEGEREAAARNIAMMAGPPAKIDAHRLALLRIGFEAGYRRAVEEIDKAKGNAVAAATGRPSTVQGKVHP